MIVTALGIDPGKVATWKSSGDWNSVDSWVLAPSAGKRLLILRTLLIVTTDFKLGCDGLTTYFRGVKTGYSGSGGESYWFERSYASFWDYCKACDDFQEYSDHVRFSWNYASPIILRSSESAELHLDLPAPVGGVHAYNAVTHAFLTCKCLSEDE